MAISAKQVKALRERTGAPMLDCKKALEAVDGNLDAAIDEMRKSGQLKAAKRAGRTAAEGLVNVLVSEDQKTAIAVEVNCETDFVALDENFVEFAKTVTQQALAAGVSDMAMIKQLHYQSSSAETIEQTRENLVSKLGENLQVRRAHIIAAKGNLGTYLHGGRIGVIVDVKGGDASLAKDVAMHIAASNPQFIQAQDVAQDVIEKEKAIFSAQAEESGKPAEIIAKMIDGRVQKYVNEITLLGQPFAKNPDMTVGQLLKGQNASVEQFIRFEVGEGIEKEESDFVAEVMAQVQE